MDKVSMRAFRIGWIIIFTLCGIWATYLAFHRNDMRPMFAAMIYFMTAFGTWYVEWRIHRRAIQESEEL